MRWSMKHDTLINIQLVHFSRALHQLSPSERWACDDGGIDVGNNDDGSIEDAH